MEIALLSSAFVASVVSGFIPFVNAEVVVAGAAVAAPPGYMIPVIAVCSLGQMLAKVALYAGMRWLPERLPKKATARLERASEKVKKLEQAGLTLVLVSAIVGLPPFYLISLAAGAMKLSLTGFIVTGTAGRAIRFAIIAYGAVAAGDVIEGTL